MGQVIHPNYCRTRGLDGWPWNSRSHGLAMVSLPICWYSSQQYFIL